MSRELEPTNIGMASNRSRERFVIPAIIADAGERAGKRFLEFFAATIRNANTRRAYARAVGDFLSYCQQGGLSLTAIEPLHVAAYIERMTRTKAAPTVKQHLAAIGMLLDWLTSGGILPFNPAASVRGPKHIVKRGKTPVLTAGEARQLLNSIVPDDPANYSTASYPMTLPTPQLSSIYATGP